jgi:hypothetical protein
VSCRIYRRGGAGVVYALCCWYVQDRCGLRRLYHLPSAHVFGRCMCDVCCDVQVLSSERYFGGGEPGTGVLLL